MSRPRIDMPAEGARPSLKWGRSVTESVLASRLTSPDHLIQETPSGTMIKHKTRPVAGGGATLPEATTLYKVIAVREFDEDDVLVPVGSESSPLAEGHVLDWTEDWVRMGTTAT